MQGLEDKQPTLKQPTHEQPPHEQPALKKIEFLFDFGSPATYLAYRRLPAIAQAANATIIWTPILLGGIFKATGNTSPAAVPAKGAYMTLDLKRFAKKHQVEFHMNPYFPINTLTLMRAATGYQRHHPTQFPTYVEAIFNAMWQTPKDLSNPDIVATTLKQASLDAELFQTLITREDVKTTLRENTEHAVARGAFGAPTMFVNAEMFFGQDRLDMLADHLAAG